MSFKKQFLKSKPVCKVSFRFEAELANGASTVQLLGDFNNWDKSAAPMTALKSNDFTATLELEAGKEYQFRYLLNGENFYHSITIRLVKACIKSRNKSREDFIPAFWIFLF